ncbi:MAG: 50S ribosomal protein L10, partial [Planctomycetota bacterium]
MPNSMKELMAADLRARLDRSADVLVVGLLPMSAERSFALRRAIRAQGAQLRVIHNRTARFALDGP